MDRLSCHSNIYCCLLATQYEHNTNILHQPTTSQWPTKYTNPDYAYGIIAIHKMKIKKKKTSTYLNRFMVVGGNQGKGRCGGEWERSTS